MVRHLFEVLFQASPGFDRRSHEWQMAVLGKMIASRVGRGNAAMRHGLILTADKLQEERAARRAKIERDANSARQSRQG